MFLGLVAHMMSAVFGQTVLILLPNLTIYYLRSACDGTVDQVGLDLNCGHLPIVTRLYHARDLVSPRPSMSFTSPASAGNGNT